MRTHEHQCDCCGYVWTCKDDAGQDFPAIDCEITAWVLNNKMGPLCFACSYGIKFLQHARLSNRSPQRLMKMLLRIEGGGDMVPAAGSASQPTLIRSGRPSETLGPAPNVP